MRKTAVSLSSDPASEVEPIDPIVCAANVCKSFRQGRSETKALNNISMEIRPGEFVSLLGPSGCGKTTLLNLVAGLTQPDSGELFYRGQQISGANQKVGYLTQDDALLPWRTVRTNVALPLEIKGRPSRERRERADEIIARVGLRGFEDHYPRQLSGGMRKRVSLARTLIYEPETLLLDEPFGALDAQTRMLMQRELLVLVRSLSLTVILVTHDLNEAIALSDRIVLFSRRPARTLDVISVMRRAIEDVGKHLPKDDAVFQRVWDQLATEIKAAETSEHTI